MASRSDEIAQPWARQSLVQLAPVWGRITDPQTVQTTTSVQSEHGFPKIQQQSARRWRFALCKCVNSHVLYCHKRPYIIILHTIQENKNVNYANEI